MKYVWSKGKVFFKTRDWNSPFRNRLRQQKIMAGMKVKKPLLNSEGSLSQKAFLTQQQLLEGRAYYFSSPFTSAHWKRLCLSLKNSPSISPPKGQYWSPVSGRGRGYWEQDLLPFRILFTWRLAPGYAQFKKEHNYKIIPFCNGASFFAEQKENLIHPTMNLFNALKGK